MVQQGEHAVTFFYVSSATLQKHHHQPHICMLKAPMHRRQRDAKVAIDAALEYCVIKARQD